MTDSCKACKFWQKQPKMNNIVISTTPTKDNGYCLRYPPLHLLMAMRGGLGNAIGFPSTEEDQLCGEFAFGACINPLPQKLDEELPKSKLLS